MGLFLWGLAYFLFGLTNLILKKYKKFIIITIINIVLIIFMILAAIIINKIYSKIDMISSSDYTLYTTNLIALKETELDSNSKLGMIENEDDVEGYKLANSLIEKENLKQEVIYYEDYYSMIDALYNHEVDAIFVSSNYVILFSGEDAYSEIGSITKVLYEYSENMKSETITSSNKKLTEPFTILLMGVDSEIDGLNANAAFNGDTLMLITFNPKTLTATIFSIPRDTYVPIACNNNRYNKINSSAAYGTQCVIDTVENLVDIEIDYYAKINFNGVIDLVNALGGIDVEVESPDYSYYISKYGEGVLCESNSLRDTTNLVCMNTGLQHLNGEQALAYARNRHGFLESDLARNRHQQQIVEAMAKKVVNVTSFSGFENILNSIGNNISTNLSTTQILSFYQTLKDMLTTALNGNDFITIQKTYLEVYSLPITVGGVQVSALGYYENSLKAITNALNVNLGLKEEEMIKTFSYDYNEEYSSMVIGKGISGGTKLETVPNFTGSIVSYAEAWALNNGITLGKEYVCSNSTPGLISNQSVASGTLAKNISYLTIYISESCNTTNTETSNNTNSSNKNNDNEEKNTTNETDDNEIVSTIPGSPEIDSDEDENTEEE
jgi:LCP family protein required for cell wall assembly